VTSPGGNELWTGHCLWTDYLYRLEDQGCTIVIAGCVAASAAGPLRSLHAFRKHRGLVGEPCPTPFLTDRPARLLRRVRKRRSPFNTVTLLKSLSCLAHSTGRKSSPRDITTGLKAVCRGLTLSKGCRNKGPKSDTSSARSSSRAITYLFLQLLAAAGANQNRFLSKRRFPFLAPALPEFFF
jgi:hypothetical protein